MNTTLLAPDPRVNNSLPQTLYRSLSLLHGTSPVVEIRILGLPTKYGKPAEAGGCYENLWLAACHAAEYDLRGPKGVYVVLNQLDPAVLSRLAPNQITERPEQTGGNADVLRRQWIFFDFDPVRVSGVSATDAEKLAAYNAAAAAGNWLTGEMGWPPLLMVDSGNGYYLLARIDLPNDDDSTGLMKAVLATVEDRFGTEAVSVDQAVSNAARLIRLPGTTNRKGYSTAERPHRQSGWVHVPPEIGIVSRDQLETVAALAPQASANVPTSSGRRLDMPRWLTERGIEFKAEPQPDGATKYHITCPFNSDHKSAALFQKANGKLGAHCFHDSCAKQRWQEFKAKIGPPDDHHYDGAASSPAQPVDPADLSAKWEPFPTHELPEPIQTFVRRTAEAAVCDDSYVAVSMLAILASLIGNSRRVRIHDLWSEPSVLWGVTIADSGTQKSPALDPMRNILERWQGAAAAQFAREWERYEDDKLIYDRELSLWKKQKDGMPPVKPPEPVERRYTVGDTTVEALADVLSHQPCGVLLLREELSGWLLGFNEYKNGKGGDVPHWLSMHGARSLERDRRSLRRRIHVRHAAVSITGTVQPDVVRKALTPELFQCRLAARILMVMPPRRPKRYVEPNCPWDLRWAVEKVFGNLYSLLLPLDESGQPMPMELPLAADAKQAWMNFVNQWGEESFHKTGEHAAAASKLEGYGVRLALILYLTRWAAEDPTAQGSYVDLAAVQAGIRLVRWFAYETERVYSMFRASPAEHAERKLIDLIKRRNGRITARELQRASRSYAKADIAEDALNRLWKSGFGKWEVEHTTTNHKRVFVLAGGL